MSASAIASWLRIPQQRRLWGGACGAASNREGGASRRLVSIDLHGYVSIDLHGY
ncbi:MAG: hypothetical protein ACXVRZ_00740 [Gaiellaceae bacterium]